MIDVGSPAPRAPDGCEQIAHRRWICIVRHRDPSDVPVYEIGNLLFECEHHACCGHDEDKYTRRDAKCQVCPEKKFSNHASFVVSCDLQASSLKSSEIVHRRDISGDFKESLLA